MTDLLDWFSEAGHAAFAAFAMALGSLVVAMVALVKSSRTQKRLLTIEEQRERDRLAETKKARLTARITEQPSGPGGWNGYLQIINEGKGEAREIQISLDGVPAMEHRSILKQQSPIRQVGPQSAARYVLDSAIGVPLPREVEMRWTDDSGEQGRYRTTLTR